MSISKKSFGVTKDGKETFLYTMTNEKGMEAAVTDFGAILVQLIVPDARGGKRDVVLGFDSVTEYEGNDCFFGSTIGRNANRIGGAAFDLDGVTYHLAANENGNNLHTEFDHGFHKVIWNAEVLEAENAVKFTYCSPDGENGFPGNLDMSVTYTMQEDNAIRIDYDGVSDKKTVINVTNHSYFNLGGHDSGSICDERIRIDADGCFSFCMKDAIFSWVPNRFILSCTDSIFYFPSALPSSNRFAASSMRLSKLLIGIPKTKSPIR